MCLSQNYNSLYQAVPPTANAYHTHIIVSPLMQVRLYSLAGHLQQHEPAFIDRPLVVQRLPSKLSSLAWDHNQNVRLPLCCSPFSVWILCVTWC